MGLLPHLMGLTLFLHVKPLSAASSSSSCELSYTPLPNGVSPSEYASSRSQCVRKCNDEGYCCTLGMGICDRAPCAEGCHIAFFTSDLAACKAQCAKVNEPGCEYTWNHDPIGHLGFHPWWDYGIGVQKCFGAEDCGCPTEDGGKECSVDACSTGCELAHEKDLRDRFFHGEDVVMDLKEGLDASVLLDAIGFVASVVEGSVSMPEKKTMEDKLHAFQKNAPLLETDFEALDAALNLVDSYEASHGPLFLNDKTQGGFSRDGSSDGTSESLLLERIMLAVQQTVLDEVYRGTPIETKAHNPHPPIIEQCAEYLSGRYWNTAAYFPGFVAPPSKSKEVSVKIGASMPAHEGFSLCFAEEPLIRPTGIYLAPGGIAKVKARSFAREGLSDSSDDFFEILVGASTSDHGSKSFHRRMDRVTSTFRIKSEYTYVASPLGGGIYIKVPYLADEGVVSVSISGDIVEAPILSLTDVRNTNKRQWNKTRKSSAPWADFETEHFMMNVPTSWIYKYSYAHMKTILQSHDEAMAAVTSFAGFPTRNKHVLYLQPDLEIKHDAFGVGYPQVNVLLESGPDGPLSWGPDGKSDHFMVATKYLQDEVCYHELGHCTLVSYYRGETEALVNILLAYVSNVLVGLDFDTAFTKSFPPFRITPDMAAMHWMVTENFREAKEMDHSDTEYDEMRYQHRGYAKYADIARLFGWDTLESFFQQEQADFNNGLIAENTYPPSDSRTLELSISVGVDLTPLIHFWGIHPVDAASLKSEMKENNLKVSDKVFDLLTRYVTIIPKNNAEFNSFFDAFWPPDGDERMYYCDQGPVWGCGWFLEWSDKYNECHAEAATVAANDIIDLYYPSQRRELRQQQQRALSSCEDTTKKIRISGKRLTCNDLRLPDNRQKCQSKKLKRLCPVACGICEGPPVCIDAKSSFVIDNSNSKTCKKINAKKHCLVSHVAEACPVSCGGLVLDEFDMSQYTLARQRCIEKCNDSGHCCTLGVGGCNYASCSTGCHFAFFSESLAQCKAQCTEANEANCGYTWNHEQIGDAGFNPWWKHGYGVEMCAEAMDCGCSSDDFGEDCTVDACEKGCILAHEESLRCSFFHGEDITVTKKDKCI